MKVVADVLQYLDSGLTLCSFQNYFLSLSMKVGSFLPGPVAIW